MSRIGAILMIAAVALATVYAFNKFGPGVATFGKS